jgi:hypothetical protein
MAIQRSAHTATLTKNLGLPSEAVEMLSEDVTWPNDLPFISVDQVSHVCLFAGLELQPTRRSCGKVHDSREMS